MGAIARALWPKRLPALTEEQLRIKADFMYHWHEVLPKRYGLIERFNQTYPLKSRPLVAPSGAAIRTLEIGCGLGEHIAYEDLEGQDYTAIEILPKMAAHVRQRFPRVRVLEADAQQRIALDDASIDRVLAIHVLEHLPNLPAALDEIRRVLRPAGVLSVVIPCEGGMAYSLARRISAQRVFERRYRMSYEWLYRSEHINLPHEILAELAKRFALVHRCYWPLRVPVTTANLVIGLTYRVGAS